MRESVDNTAARLWRRHFSVTPARFTLLVIPEELASGGAIRRRRSLGIFLVDGLLKSLARLWTSSPSISG
jgi:hypothetical protein